MGLWQVKVWGGSCPARGERRANAAAAANAAGQRGQRCCRGNKDLWAPEPFTVAAVHVWQGHAVWASAGGAETLLMPSTAGLGFHWHSRNGSAEDLNSNCQSVTSWPAFRKPDDKGSHDIGALCKQLA